MAGFEPIMRHFHGDKLRWRRILVKQLEVREA